MAPQWTPTEDRALLLALVQVMAPSGPSKHQFEAAVKLVNDRWTVSAVSQHYNKKMRILSPLDTLEDTGPSTPTRSATKRKVGASSGTKKVTASPLKDDEEVKGQEDDGEVPKAKKVKKAKAKAAEEGGEGEVEDGVDDE